MRGEERKEQPLCLVRTALCAPPRSVQMRSSELWRHRAHNHPNGAINSPPPPSTLLHFTPPPSLAQTAVTVGTNGWPAGELGYICKNIWVHSLTRKIYISNGSLYIYVTRRPAEHQNWAGFWNVPPIDQINCNYYLVCLWSHFKSLSFQLRFSLETNR